jgi:predicted Ser/Thr protein kinase
METARFLRLRDLFDRAMQLPASCQDAFLQRECSGDPQLLADARQLLAAHLAAVSRADVPAEEGRAVPESVPLPTLTLEHPDISPADARVVGPYRIRGQIGEGGMGTVYLAIRDDGTFRKSVALKILRKDHATTEFVERFQQERQVLANLDHGNIARILDGGQTPDGLPYYVMEYVDGTQLDNFCDDRKLDLAGRVSIFLQICRAVHYLHENLVVHRDLKPSNILVTSDGTVKLLDFGIAKQQIPAANIELTALQGRVMTPGYASPEQFSGSPVSKASDIYSLGVILYLLLTGSLPHSNPGAKLTTEPEAPSSKIRTDIQRTPETTSQLRRRIVGDLDQVVLMCLRRDPQNRYASAKDLGDDLERFLDGRPVAARKGPVAERLVRFVKRNRLAVAICALLIVLGVFGASQALEARGQSRRVLAREAEIARLARLLDVLDKRDSANLPASVRVEDVRQLREALGRDLPSAGHALIPQQRALLQRGMNYLEKVKPYAAGDPALAGEVAAAWKQVGVIYQQVDPNVASIAFNNATGVLSGTAAAESAQGPRHGQAPSAAPGSGAARLHGDPRRPEASQPGAVLQQDEPDQAASANRNVVDAAAYKEFKSSLDSVTAKSLVADDTIAELRRNAQRLGQVVHPDIETWYQRMKLALDAAKKAADGGDLHEANENLGTADANADRVLKEGGR